MVAYPFCPSWAAVGEQVTAGYAAFFFSLYGTRLSVIALRKETEKLRNDGRSVFDKQASRSRSIVEQTIGWLKECRRIGTRFEKLAINFLAIMKHAMIQQCLKMKFPVRVQLLSWHISPGDLYFATDSISSA